MSIIRRCTHDIQCNSMLNRKVNIQFRGKYKIKIGDEDFFFFFLPSFFAPETKKTMSSSLSSHTATAALKSFPISLNPKLFDYGMLFVQAVDAVTPNSSAAFSVLCDLPGLHKEDHVRVLHCYNESKCPADIPQALKEYFETRLTSRLSRKRFDLVSQ